MVLQRIEQVALLFGLHARRAAQIENRIAARAERSSLIRRREKALAVNRGSRPDAAFQQHHETRQILVLACRDHRGSTTRDSAGQCAASRY